LLTEVKFGPLSFKQQFLPLFEYLGKHPTLKVYADEVRKLAVVRILQQLSTVFKSIRSEQKGTQP
jgi:hypothetical protein